MRNQGLFLILVTILSLTIGNLGSYGQVLVAGIWKGTYTCTQGATGLTLTIQTEGEKAKAIFSFYPLKSNPGVPSGSYELTGRISNRRVILRPSRWINQPTGYSMLGVTLTWNERNDRLEGVICGNAVELKREGVVAQQSKVETSNVAKDGKKFFLAGSIGAQSMKWEPSASEDDFLEFNTEGLNSFSIYADIGFNDRHLFSLSYDGLFKYSPSQKEMLKTNKTSEKGLEKYTFGISLAPIILSIIDDQNFFKRFARNLLSVKFTQSRTLFFGQITGTRNYYYTPFNSNITFSTPVDSIPLYEVGKSHNFKTLFIENEASFPLFSVRYIKGRDISHQFILGFYSTSYERPATYFHYDVNGTPMCLEHRFFSKGITMGIQTIERSYPGLNIDWKFFSGIMNSDVLVWKTNVNDYFKENYNYDISSTGFTIHMWYNHYFSNSRSSLTVGFSASAFMWTWTDLDPKSDKSGTFEMEGRVNYYFRYLFRL